MTVSKLQSEAVKEFNLTLSSLIKNISVGQYNDKGVNIGFKSGKEVIKQFLSDQIQKAYSKGREEVIKEKDIAEKFLYSNLPLDLSIGTEFEVGGRYEDWGFVVNYKGNKISEGGTLEQAINNAKIKLSIQSKEK